MQPQNKNIFELFESLFVLAGLFFCSGAVVPVLLNPGDKFTPAAASEPIVLVIELLVYGLLLLFGIVFRSRIMEAIKANHFLTALLVWGGMSVLWSGAPDVTLRRVVLLAATTVFGMYLGIRFTIPEILRYFAYVMFIAMLLSVVFIVALPGYGNEGHSNIGAWRGVFLQKNIFARYMVLSVFTFLFLKPRTPFEKVFKTVGLLFAIGLVAGSLSVGSYVAVFIGFLLIPVFSLFRLPWRKLLPVAIPTAIFAVAVLIWARLNAHMLVTSLGRNGTLTGRVPLWHVLMTFVGQRPLLGYGVDGFWTSHGYQVWTLLGYADWKPLHAHNGYIDLCLQLGIVGSALFVIQMLIVLWRATRVIATERTFGAQWPLMLLSLTLFYNFFESDLMKENGFLWVAFSALTVALQRYVIAHRSAVKVNSVIPDVAIGEALPCG